MKSKCHTLLKDRHIVKSRKFTLHLLAGGDRHNLIEQALPCRIQTFALSDNAGVEVDPVVLFARKP